MPRPRDPEERLLSWVSLQPASGCWEWQGGMTRGGYGKSYWQGRTVLAHRMAYRLFVGSIPDGLQLDHLCRNRSCCNPAHLEPVTPGVNVRRGDTGSNNRDKTHCPQGHEYTADNIYWFGRQRRCRECALSRVQEKRVDNAAV